MYAVSLEVSISLFIILEITPLTSICTYLFIYIYKDKHPPPVDPMVEDSQDTTAIGKKEKGISSVSSSKFLFLFSLEQGRTESP